MSPRQLGTLTDRYRAQRQREDILAGIQAATVANYSMGRPENTWYQPWDFVPSIEKPPEPEDSDEVIAQRINALLLPRAVEVSREKGT